MTVKVTHAVQRIVRHIGRAVTTDNVRDLHNAWHSTAGYRSSSTNTPKPPGKAADHPRPTRPTLLLPTAVRGAR
eukprot:3223964-Prymnesium_polylepis.1